MGLNNTIADFYTKIEGQNDEHILAIFAFLHRKIMFRYGAVFT